MTFLRRGIRALHPELVHLRTLRLPHDAPGAYDTAVGTFALELNAMQDALRRLQHDADPVAEIQALQQRLGPLEARENAAWQTLGVPACMNR